MFSRGKRVCISLLLLLLFALVGCGPPVAKLTTAPAPTATGGGTGGGGTGGGTGGGGAGQPTGSSTDSTSPAGTESPSPTETNSETATPTDSPSETKTATPTNTQTTPPVTEVPTIDCTPGVPASSASPASTTAPQQSPTGGAQATLDIVLAGVPQCSVASVAAVALPENAGCLFVYVDVHTAEPGEAPVALFLSSDTGLSHEDSLVASSEPRTKAVRVQLRASDFGKTHTVTMTAAPQNAVKDPVEANNVYKVKVTIPTADQVNQAALCPTDPSTPASGPSDHSNPADGPTDIPATAG